MTAYWTQPEHAAEYDDWVNDLLVNAPESYDGDESAESIVTQYLHDLESAIEEAWRYGFHHAVGCVAYGSLDWDDCTCYLGRMREVRAHVLREQAR